jgi:hypothetical protein
MKELLKEIKPPLTWQMSVTILLGFFWGVAVYVIYISKATSCLGNKPENPCYK